MPFDPPFQYNELKSKEIRLFKLDLTDESGELSGNIVTIRHPCQSDLTLKNFGGIFLNWKDAEFVQSSAEAGNLGYDALSYAWGTRDITYPLTMSTTGKSYKHGAIDVDGQKKQRGTVQIQSSLHAVLQELRRQNYSRFL